MRKYVLSLFMVLISLGIVAQGDIYLSMPNDGELIKEKALNFVWQVSALSNQDDPRLTQELVIAEMKTNQTPFEAIEVNGPIFLKSNLIGTSYYVSNSSFPFVEGKKYAWQVRYYMNNIPISKSDVWWFEIAKPEIKYDGFIPLRQKSDGQILKLSSKQLNVSLISRGDLNLGISIVSAEGMRIESKFSEINGQEILEGEVSTTRNNNRTFTLDLKELKLKKGFYTLEWNPKKGESYVLNFELL